MSILQENNSLNIIVFEPVILCVKLSVIDNEMRDLNRSNQQF